MYAKPEDQIAVLVFACNRTSAIENHLSQLIRFQVLIVFSNLFAKVCAGILRPSKESFPIIVSQDCDDNETTSMIESYGDNVTLLHQPDQSEFKLADSSQQFLGYYKIARHYRWALNQTFFEFQYKSVIITEGIFYFAVFFRITVF